jgi:hypothetical protein
MTSAQKSPVVSFPQNVNNESKLYEDLEVVPGDIRDLEHYPNTTYQTLYILTAIQ